MNLDDRLRAAGQALREGSAAQVDATGGLREIVLAGRPPAGPAAAPGSEPAPPPLASPLLRRAQRLALAVNLLLVLALGVALGVVAVGARDVADRRAASIQRPAATSPLTSAPPATTVTRTVVPQTCLEAAELADEIIAALNRNDRGSRLATAMREYSVANQACREQASPTPPPTTPPTTRPSPAPEPLRDRRRAAGGPARRPGWRTRPGGGRA
jgi:hypothetical protein